MNKRSGASKEAADKLVRGIKRKSSRSMISLHCDIDLHFNLNSEFFQYLEKGYGLSQICGENPCFFDLSIIEITEETLSQKNEKNW